MQSKDPDATKNLLIAAALSAIVLFGWQFFIAGPQMQAQQERIARQKLEAEQAAKHGGGQPGVALPSATSGGTIGAGAPAAQGTLALAATREEALKRSARVAIETPSLTGSISLKGGLVDDLVLVKYREKVDPASPNVVLFSPPEAPGAYYAKYGWLNAGGGQPKLPDGETVWKAEADAKLTPGSPVKLSWDNGEGLIFHRTISIDDLYMLKVDEQVENKGTAEVTLRPFALLYRRGTPKIEGYSILHEGFIAVADDKVSWCGTFFASQLCEITYHAALEESGSKSFDAKAGGWLGITDKYWAATLVPDQAAPYTASFQGRAGTGAQKEFYTADYGLAPLSVAPGQSKSVSGHLYAGAKQVRVVEEYERSLGIKQFDLLIDWGWFYFITKPFNHLIDWLYGILGNFGLAILAVTVLVKLAFFPLANKSYEAMAKMKKLQPQMEAIRERYKDDKAKQQQEVMALYQKEKINPAAGCLPILVQIPVFFALYKVLFVSIDMRHAPFYGWIQDLSAADPTSIFNLFGLLPFAVPEFLHIGVWPIIMGVTMWIQMQLNPPQPDPIQQAMFSWMPLIFTFLLAAFPAGLVIYWAWNNILSIGQQWYITKKQGAEIHLFDNMSRTFGPVMRWFRRYLPGSEAEATPAPVAVSSAKPKPLAQPAESKSASPAAPPSDTKPEPGAEPAVAEQSAPIDTAARDGSPRTAEEAFRVLGLKQGASEQQINAAYKRLSEKHRPGKSAKARGSLAQLELAKDLALKSKATRH